MEMEGASSSGSSALTQPILHRSRRSRALYRFTQQNLPACKPALTPTLIITAFLLTGVAFMPVGLICLRASESIEELVMRYDIECIPKNYRGNKVAYIKDESVSKKCTLSIKFEGYYVIEAFGLLRIDQQDILLSSLFTVCGDQTPKSLYLFNYYEVLRSTHYVQPRNYMKAPIYIYYELDNYYQNHRRYIKSTSDKQLRYGLQQEDISSCNPVASSNGLPVVPCGLIAWSLFNDTFSFDVKAEKLAVNRKNISWKSDRDYKFGKDVYPLNFQNNTLIGGGKLDPSIPLSEQEDLIVWMRIAALPKFRKLYGVIEEDLNADELVTVHLVNNYNTYSSGGKKKLVLTTSNWLGGKNNFLGLAYIATGCSNILLAILFALIHVKFPRPRYDTSHLQWNRRGSAR